MYPQKKNCIYMLCTPFKQNAPPRSPTMKVHNNIDTHKLNSYTMKKKRDSICTLLLYTFSMMIVEMG